VKFNKYGKVVMKPVSTERNVDGLGVTMPVSFIVDGLRFFNAVAVTPQRNGLRNRNRLSLPFLRNGRRNRLPSNFAGNLCIQRWLKRKGE
jgi:hypothetical protein